MKVIVRANNSGASDAEQHQVVVEIRMSSEEVKLQGHRSAALETVMDEALEEHIKNGHRVARSVAIRRG